MLAIVTDDALFISDAYSLKRGSLPSPLSLSPRPVNCAWSLDGSSAYLASNAGVHRYDCVSGSTENISDFSEPHDSPQILVKDNSSILATDGHRVLVVDRKGKTLQTFDAHHAPVKAISLSANNLHLAVATSKAVYVYNMLTGSHNVLRGLGLASQPLGACVFHPHSPTRLLLGIGRQLVIYDINRTSGPTKVITLDDASTGDISAISSSPFSKSLVAMITTNGNLGLVDMDKEKGLFRTLDLGIELTCISFSPEGASIYLGTCDGRVLVVDLRALEKPPKEVSVNNDKKPIRYIIVQGKSSTSESRTSTTPGSSKSISSSSAKRLPPTSSKTATGKSPAKAAPLKKEPSAPRVARKVSAKDSLNVSNDSQVSVQLDGLNTFKPGSTSKEAGSPRSTHTSRTTPPGVKASPKVPSRVAASAKVSKVASPVRASKDIPRKPRTLPTNLRKQPETTVPPSSSLEVPSEGTSRPTSRQRAASSASRTASETVSISSTSSKLFSATSRKSSASSRPPSSVSCRPTSPAPSIVPSVQSRKVSTASSRATNRTPSPDLPGIGLDPSTPIPANKKRTAFGNLGLGTPEVKRWIDAGNEPAKGDKGKGKVVDFMPENIQDHNEDDSDKENDGERSLVISPLRPGISRDEWAPVPSPTRYPMPSSPSMHAAGPAHELLRTIVKDVMYDFQQETRGEMMGLHLDLVRMGRSWKKELREVMAEYVSDLKELKEENSRLRAENDRLRRGY